MAAVCSDCSALSATDADPQESNRCVGEVKVNAVWAMPVPELMSTAPSMRKVSVTRLPPVFEHRHRSARFGENTKARYLSGSGPLSKLLEF